MSVAGRVTSAALSARRWRSGVNLCQHLLLRHLEEGRSQRIALLFRDEEMTYAQLAGLVRQLAAVLRARGVCKGDRVGLVLPDTPTYVAAFFGALHLGATVVPLNPQLPVGEAEAMFRRTRARLVLIDETAASAFDADRLQAKIIRCGDCLERRSELESELSAAKGYAGPAVDTEGIPAYCLFSSGTTGRPKGIPHKHTDILYCIEAYSLQTLGMGPEDRVLAVPKLTFGYGLGGNLLSAFYVGGTAILVEEPSNGLSMSEAARRFRPTLFLAQPRALGELIQLNCRDPFGSLRLAVSAGEALVRPLYDRWLAETAVELLDGFGSTEVGHVFISNSIGAVAAGSAGRVLPPFEIKLVNEQGLLVQPREVGQLWVRGPSLTTGYWEEPERTAKSFIDGWAYTGDLASQDEEGYVYLAGRADEIIKAGCGQWVSPTEIESVLQGDPAVREVAAIGVSDRFGIVSPKAFVVLQPDNTPTVELENRLRELVVNRWPQLTYKHLSSVEFVSSLPKTASGKLRRFALGPASMTEFSYQC